MHRGNFNLTMPYLKQFMFFLCLVYKMNDKKGDENYIKLAKKFIQNRC